VLDPLDEHPIHQVPRSMRYVGTTDRNVYDRCVYQAVDHEAETFLLTGLGVYPNLGVIDAYASVRRGDTQWTMQTSGSRPDDLMKQEVGPYRIEVLDPFTQVRLVCDADDHGIGFDLLFESTFAPIEEPHHLRWQGDRLLFDACRFAQVGTWTGSLRVDGEAIDVTPDRWTATRDRSWGIRPVGEQPRGRPFEYEHKYWCWVPLRFDEFAIHMFIEEDPNGDRTTNFAVQVWPKETGRPSEQLGWPYIDIDYRAGTRHVEHATFDLRTPRRQPLTIEIEPLLGIPLDLGCGYGADPEEWRHGVWKGDTWIEGAVFDYGDPALSGRTAWLGTEHIARATCDGRVGYGILEHGVGQHAPSGFTDLTPVAP
jgi:hypothetical protein